MPFVQRIVEPKYLCRNSLFNEDGTPLVNDNELAAVTNNTLSNALRQLASLLFVANDIFKELGTQFQNINERTESLKQKITSLDDKVAAFDPKKVSVPEGDICSFALLKEHYVSNQKFDQNLFAIETRPTALKELYDAAVKTPVNVMRQLDRWRRDGHRSSGFFLCTPILGEKRKQIKNIDIETNVPVAFEELRKWTSYEALGDITVTPDCVSKIAGFSEDEGDYLDQVNHKLPSPEDQVRTVALKFPPEIVAVDVSGKSFDRLSGLRHSFMNGNASHDENAVKRRTKPRRPRPRRRTTLAGIDKKEIQEALTTREEDLVDHDPDSIFARLSHSTDILSTNKKGKLDKKSHLNSIKQWGKSQYDRFLTKSKYSTKEDYIPNINSSTDTCTYKRNNSLTSSEKSYSMAIILGNNNNVKLRETSTQRMRRALGDRDEPNSSSGNWSASSESGRTSTGSEITITTHPKSTTSTINSSNSLSRPPNSVGSVRKRFTDFSTSTSESVRSDDGTITPDVMNEDETCSIYSCDTEGYYTSFHMDSGLKTLREEELPCKAIQRTSALSNCNEITTLSAENEYELFGKGSTSTTTSSAGTVCTTLISPENKSYPLGPVVPERKSSLLNRCSSDGTIKRSPVHFKPIVVAEIHKKPDEHRTSTSPKRMKTLDTEDYETIDTEGSERIRFKTKINSSRIPSMCIITPSPSDDESTHSHDLNKNKYDFDKYENNNLSFRKEICETLQDFVIEDNQCTFPLDDVIYATDTNLNDHELNNNKTVENAPPTYLNLQDTINSNIPYIESPETNEDIGEYVRISDCAINTNERLDNENQYISLNDLSDKNKNFQDNENRRRQGARVTLDPDGKVMYSSDSLKRTKTEQSTFEPGPYVKTTNDVQNTQTHRNITSVRPIQLSQKRRIANVPQTEFNCPLSPHLGRIVIRASTGSTPEVVRMTPTTIVSPTVRTTTVKPISRGAYVNVEGSSPVPVQSKGKLVYVSKPSSSYTNSSSDKSLPDHYSIPNEIIEPTTYENKSLKISPINPRNDGEFKTSTPSGNKHLKAAINLDANMLSNKKSTMSNEELYAIIHKSKKKMKIDQDPANSSINSNPDIPLRHETSPVKQDKKAMSTMDFKRLLLQKSSYLFPNTKKMSAVEQLRLSKQHMKTNEQSSKSDLVILNLSGSPRSFNRRIYPNDKPTTSPSKILSPRSQWKFMNPRSDVLSTTIPEDCSEDEDNIDPNINTSALNTKSSTTPALETAL